MFTHKTGPRAEYRIKQGLRVTASPTLAVKYGKLKALMVNIGYFAPEGKSAHRKLTYSVNLSHAKSVFRLNCANDECVQGDHELTKEIAGAIAKHSKTVAGEQCCHGWLSKDAINITKCNHVMHYKLKLAY